MLRPAQRRQRGCSMRTAEQRICLWRADLVDWFAVRLAAPRRRAVSLQSPSTLRSPLRFRLRCRAVSFRESSCIFGNNSGIRLTQRIRYSISRHEKFRPPVSSPYATLRAHSRHAARFRATPLYARLHPQRGSQSHVAAPAATLIVVLASAL